MLFAVLVPFIALVAASPAAVSPSCAASITPVINSITSRYAHPRVYCSNYLGVVNKTVTRTSTVYSKTVTRTDQDYTLVATVAAPTSTQTVFTTVISYASTGTCVSGNGAGKRAAAASTSTYAASLVSSACSCIGPVTRKVTSTVTRTARSFTTTTSLVSYTETTTPVSVTTQTNTVAVWATNTRPFKMQVTNFYAGRYEENLQADGLFLDCPGSNCYGNNIPFSGSTDLQFVISNCGELTVVHGNDDNTSILGKIAIFTQNYPGNGYSFYFNTPADTKARGWLVWSCFIEPVTNYVSCSGGGDVSSFGSYAGYGVIAVPGYQGGDYFGHLNYTAVYTDGAV